MTKNFLKNVRFLLEKNAFVKMILNLIFTERLNIYKIIKENFNKPIESNPNLSKFDINTCHLCDKKIRNNPVKNQSLYIKNVRICT